ncbi:hypothetical protein GCM10010145_05030 [Streptomyces ruber]|uniref:Uncharacterized protein n=2 Tax=Streptomyces TaxID=1883 RepID=A0A918EQ30_9ACTN|nr:hypothetical protein [Streptomyces ruber]GGQ40166.1 hypothetical protein GCM10010145_05030 [Streptomyces ruber]
MSLVELLAQADERGLTAAGLACLDRCVPLLGGGDEVLRPLWVSLVEDGAEWGERIDWLRESLGAGGPDDPPGGAPGSVDGADPATGEAAALARRMLAAVPAEWSADALREWAGICSAAALRIHRLLDSADGPADGPAGGPADGTGGNRTGDDRTGEDRTGEASPLVAAELRRQETVLVLLAGHGAAGVRQALDVSTEGRRVLRAVVSRRARARV